MTTPAQLPVVPVSFSRLAAYQECPYKAKNAGYETSVPAIIGNIVHDGIRLYFREAGRNPDPVKQQIQAEIVQNGLQPEDARRALELFDKFLANPFYQFPEDRIMAVESDDGEIVDRGRQMFLVKLPVAVPDADGNKVQIAIRGGMDVTLTAKRPEDGIEIIDWKTGFKDASQFQAELYALAAFLKYWRTAPIRVRFAYLQRGFSSYEDYSEADMPGILQYVAIIAAAYVKETEWKPRFSAACKNCDFKLTCPEYLEVMSKAPIKPEIDPENFGAMFKWFEHMKAIETCAGAFKEDMQGLMKSYLEKHEKAQTPDGRTATLGERVTRYKYPAEPVREVLARHGIPYDKGFVFNRGEFDTWLEDEAIRGNIQAPEAEAVQAELEKLKDPQKTMQIKFKTG